MAPVLQADRGAAEFPFQSVAVTVISMVPLKPAVANWKLKLRWPAAPRTSAPRMVAG
jgi:hypothetical protein